MAVRGTNSMLIIRVVFLLCAISTLPKMSITFELHDTINALREENIYLHDKVENLTEALRELKQFIWNHSKGAESGSVHWNADLQHLWEQWTENGISTNTHQLLEHAFCKQDSHTGAANSPWPLPLLITVSFVYLCLLLF